MKRTNGNGLWAGLLMAAMVILGGCAEGMFWRSGQYVPWVQKQWEEEERIADTQFARKRRLNELTLAAENQPVEQQTRAAGELASVIREDPVLLTRCHAVRLLGRLNCPASVEALVEASRDPESDVRIAAVRSWAQLPGETAIPQLQEILGSDTHIDVRLAATKALGQFQGNRPVAALSLALHDPDPALQLCATESLASATGEKLGRDVPAWKQYVQQSLPEAMHQGGPSRQAESGNLLIK